MGTSPTRTCVACRQRGEQRLLLRLVCVDGVVVDGTRPRRPGRGAYLHPTIACLETAMRRGAFARAFRRRVEVDQGLVGRMTATGRLE